MDLPVEQSQPTVACGGRARDPVTSEMLVVMALPKDPLEGAWMLDPPPRIARPQFVVPVAVDPSGQRGPTYGQSRGPHWRRTSPNRFVPSDAIYDETTQRIVEVAAALPPDAAITGWASLRLAGAPYFDGRDHRMRELPVPVVAARGRHRRELEGARVHREGFRPDEIVHRLGARCTSVDRAIQDEMRHSDDVRLAVEVIDMACHAQFTSLARFGVYVDAAPRRVGMPTLRAALELASEGAQSRQEVQMRLIWEVDAGLPRPLCNPTLYSSSGRFLARPDLLDRVAGVVGEYDGIHHDADPQRGRDNTREQRLRNHGLEYFAAVRGELAAKIMVPRMHAARARAATSRMPRAWTLVRPLHLTPELTLDEILDRRPPPI
ncbi:hypothetical protein ASD66_17655 [Nocardioides sp. Root151]|nr:hypothetical protein ASD66_17655 [Nocardioides sp. Root151]